MGPAEGLWRAGVRDLVCVTRPDGTLSPRSNINPDDMGKAPGKLRYDGAWSGYNWREGEVTLSDVKEWDAWGANVGIRAGRYPGIDLDVNDPELTAELIELFTMFLGPAPIRRGREPHALLVYRAAPGASIRRSRVRFDLGDGVEHLVEVLGEGQQWVAKGTHPSGAAYDVELEGVIAGSELKVAVLMEVDEDAISAALEVLEGWVRGKGGVITSKALHEGTDRAAVDQESLKGDPEVLVPAVRAIPNSSEWFPAREDYIRMGYAVKAALGEDGFEHWWDWCERWEDGANDPEEARRDWDKMKPPFSIGAGWILDVARSFGHDVPVTEFEALEDGPPPPPPARPEVGERDGQRPGWLPYSEAAMARRLVRRHQDDIVYCKELGGWLVWTGSVWKPDELDQVEGRYADLVLGEGAIEALERIENARTAEATATRLATGRFRREVVGLASKDPEVRVPIGRFDAEPWETGTPAGIIELESGELRPARRGDYLLQQTAVVPEPGRPERWLRFLDEATGGDEEFIGYLQRLCGYILTGSTREHAMFFLYGPGGNGKSVFVSLLHYIMGSYAQVAPMETFLESKYGSHPTDLASLKGARLVTAQETQEGRSWDEQKIKTLTAGDEVKARFMRQDFFSYTPGYKLLFSGNHRPRIDNLDDAWKRRVHLIPFTQVPDRIDRQLQEKLRAEAGQILAWMIEGCLMYQAIGLEKPAAVEQETREYFADEDPFGDFVRERLELGDPDTFTITHELFDGWREWCYAVGMPHGTIKAFSIQLRDRLGLEKGNDPATRRKGFHGVRLLPSVDGRGADLKVLS